LSIDCKATVHIGEFSRGGMTRGDHQACDHDFGCREKYIPCGVVDEDSGELRTDFSVVLFRPDFMLAFEEHPMKVHKNQRLLTLPSPHDLP
jgi:hypothetical protein